MYESFYGLSSKPFQLNPDPSFYFGSKQHRRATAYLEYGMHQNEGFIVITGEVGAGKTTIVRGLLDSLDAEKVVAAHLVSTQLDADDTLRLVGAAFGVRTKDVAKSDVLMALEAFLYNFTLKGKRCVLIVDEAQNLTPRAVEELRMLSNFQYGNHALLQSFLVGQPEFREMLQSPHMQQLRQRVIASCHIGPMDAEETRGYIEHRLKCAGWKENPAFGDDAHAAIFEASGGVPRRINLLCDRLLLFGFMGGKTALGADDVREVAKEIYDETSAPAASGGVRPVLPHASGAERTLAPVRLNETGPFKLDLAKLQFAAQDAGLGSPLGAGQIDERLLRLERAILRVESMNSATLGLLQQLIDAVRATREAEREVE
ncbi:MAG: AAA family ATPase [Burkholderiales bacterium]|nr:AAA family ATPase [Burkholderiales bacterium]